jgi:hypothetical protein
MIIAIVPLIFAIIGLLIYALASNSKVIEIGRLTFFAGLLISLYAVMNHTVHIS